MTEKIDSLLSRIRTFLVWVRDTMTEEDMIDARDAAEALDSEIDTFYEEEES